MIKSLKQFIAEAERKFSPEHESLIHHLLLGHSGKNFQEMYAQGTHLEKPENPTERNTNETITAFYNHSLIRDDEDVPELTGTYIKTAIGRLREQGHEPAINTRKEGEMSHANRIKEVGGIEKVFKMRKKGLHDSEIFKGTTPDQQNKLRKYIDNVHGNHDNYSPPNAKRPQKHNKERDEEILRLLKSGISVREMSRKTGRSVGSISGTIHRKKLREKLS